MRLLALSARVDKNDVFRTRTIEERRANVAEADLQTVLDTITNHIIDGNITDPHQIQFIVTDELSKYQTLATNKNVDWIKETIGRMVIRTDQLLKASGAVMPTYPGPRTIDTAIRDALVLNVQNEIESLTAAVKVKVTQALIQGMDAGDGPRTIARNISEDVGMERSRAVLIARTETNRAANQTAEDNYRRHGVQKVQWLATPDERECEVCAAHDGEIYDIDEHPEIPAHPNCRCVLIPVIEDVSS